MMESLFYNKSSILFLLFLIISVSAFCASEPSLNEVEEDEAGVKIFALADCGYLKLDLQENIAYINTDNKFWKSLNANEKERLCNLAGIFFSRYYKIEGKELSKVIFLDLTSGSMLAYSLINKKQIDVSISK